MAAKRRAKEPVSTVRTEFAALLADVKGRIQTAQTRAMLAVNSELVRLYWDIGRMIGERQQREGWGAAVIPRLAAELKNELPELKGFSERNIKRMLAFYREYADSKAMPQPVARPLLGSQFVPQPAAQLAVAEQVPQPAALTPETRRCRFLGGESEPSLVA